jgi:hypothetical protein
MATMTIVSFPKGVSAPASLDLSGGPPFARDWPTEFALDWVDGAGNIVFHFNARPEEREVALNSWFGEWGGEVLVRPYPFALEPGLPFHLRFEVLEQCFLVLVDGQPYCAFPHRAPPSSIAQLRANIPLWRLERPGLALAPDASTVLPRRPAPDWVSAQDNPQQAEPLESFRLFAVVGSWLEEDVIAATVANCFRQGCERVYLVDNESTDETVARALAAGATLGRSFSTARYDEAERISQMQSLVADVSAAEGGHIWWLWSDADEFHHGPGGLTLREYLATLDRRFRVVGSRHFNHFPSGQPAYVEGRHPLDYQPLCYEVSEPFCELGHSNHPLHRWDREGPPIVSGLGAHAATSADQLLEPSVAAFFHHFPYRAEPATRRRLEQLYRSNTGATRAVQGDTSQAHMQLRLRSLDAVYEQRWEEVRFFPPCVPGYVPTMKGWPEWVAARDRTVARWYEEAPRLD